VSLTEVLGSCRGCGALFSLEVVPVHGRGAGANVQAGEHYFRLMPDPIVDYRRGRSDLPDRLLHRPKLVPCGGEVALFGAL
jgi:hypothetical protein